MLPLSAILVASEAMAAFKCPRRSYDLRLETSNLDYPSIHVHIASNSHGGLRGHGSLQTASKVKSDLGIQLSDNSVTLHMFHLSFGLLNASIS